jgi:hypothetical protein
MMQNYEISLGQLVLGDIRNMFLVNDLSVFLFSGTPLAYQKRR